MSTGQAFSGGFVTLGMFIVDEFSFADQEGRPTGRTLPPQESIGGGGTYAAIGARIWLPAKEIGMIVDKGYDFPAPLERELLSHGSEMWIFREQSHCMTTRSLNSYRGEHRNFEYVTPRIRITPKDLVGTKIPTPQILHFICSPTRALTIVSEVQAVDPHWHPTMIYEPIPDRCIPEELPALIEVLPSITILSPNAEEALTMLSIPLPPTPLSIEQAADRFLACGVGNSRSGWVIIRSGDLGAYVKNLNSNGLWVSPFWTANDRGRVVDVTGAGNSFLGGLAAGLLLTGDVVRATFYASVSASFIIEQEGLPILLEDAGNPLWNGDIPRRRLEVLLARHENQ